MTHVAEPLEPAVGDLLRHEDARHRRQCGRARRTAARPMPGLVGGLPARGR
jgi:hypothetical protein